MWNCLNSLLRLLTFQFHEFRKCGRAPTLPSAQDIFRSFSAILIYYAHLLMDLLCQMCSLVKYSRYLLTVSIQQTLTATLYSFSAYICYIYNFINLSFLL